MKIEIANNAGFCFGVRQAIEKGEELAAENRGAIATLGPLIHNPQEVGRLESLGITAHDSFDDMHEPNVLLRTHGVAPEVYEEAERRGFHTFDCTCPKVQHVQKIAKRHADEGYQVFILGDKNHPEVEGIVGWTGHSAIVFFDTDELSRLAGGYE